MRRFFENENKIVLFAILFLFTAAFARNSAQGTVDNGHSMIAADSVLLAHGPSVPPDPWEGVRLAHGPSVPPDPWEGVRLAHGPSVPPDPWEGVSIAA
jgi:hypothetical protein